MAFDESKLVCYDFQRFEVLLLFVVLIIHCVLDCCIEVPLCAKLQVGSSQGSLHPYDNENLATTIYNPL